MRPVPKLLWAVWFKVDQRLDRPYTVADNFFHSLIDSLQIVSQTPVAFQRAVTAFVVSINEVTQRRVRLY